MSIEIPKACQSCPKVFRTREMLALLERQEDRMFRGALSSTTEEVAVVVAEMRGSGASIAVVGDDGEVQDTLTDEGAVALRAAFDAQLESIRTVINTHEEAMVEGVQDCPGARTLKAVDDDGAYEMSFCRSPQLTGNEHRENGLPSVEGVEGAYIRRLSDQQPVNE